MTALVNFVRSAGKKWREVEAKVVTGINLDIYDQIERSTGSDQSVANIKYTNIFLKHHKYERQIERRPSVDQI